ncbi:alpha/beta hydrolase [Bacillus sp. CGMCC 1.16607]|uniref:alpha/beta hydrolase n=1 Tax=Bacillus sp. CGMCC 1.16607 TaxID=3351842 RepID=UPI003642BF5B
MKKLYKVLFSFLAIFSAVGALGYFFSSRLMYIKKKENDFILQRETAAGRFQPLDFDHLPKREVKIESPFGYLLNAVLVEPHRSNRYIIVCHGVTENKMNSIKYMNLFLNRGFNVLIYDHRRHGESGGNTTSFGHYEKFDLKAVVDWLRNEIGPLLQLGIHGESMGAATLLLYAGMLEDAADFYIADCPFSSFDEQVKYLLKREMKLPPKGLIPLGDFFIKKRDRYSIKEVSPISVIQNIKSPILFIHSKKDDYILPSMTIDLFEKKQGPKMLYLAEHGVHAQSLNENKEDYEKAIDEFLKKYVYVEEEVYL